MKILVINSGSSSLKYQFFNMPATDPLTTGLVERIGLPGSTVTNHGEALKEVLNALSAKGIIHGPDDVDLVGHRVVHGGEKFCRATEITPEVKEQIKALFSLAPLHNQVSYTCIEVAEHTFPKAKQVAVFDTAFHHTLPDYAYRYAIPKSYYEDYGVRVYGFHGTSHKNVSKQAMAYLGNPDARLITLHLGNGCSVAAVKAGKSIETSMGFGPLSGLVMGTRSGDIDPSVVFHLIDQEQFTVAQVSNLLNKGAGLLGMAGSNDLRDVHKLADQGSKEAALALKLYAYRIKKFIGAYAAVLNGIDAVVFTGGVGENDRVMRAMVCDALEYLGIAFDEEQNKVAGGQIFEVNQPNAKVKILVAKTNEELEIANECFALFQPDLSH
ncbi:acetate/propionate family kinase [Pedobacter sp. SAFR-022]|uniref:acetate/propionate family kinase n=1 Tax=Pedobacter sp. SAFR-022 TaxID=3436861 RepID=UPI003F7EC9A7